MKANELRLGNLVIDGHDVEVVNYRMIEMLVKNQAEFDPIPLTEEWVEKFGFHFKGDDEYRLDGEYHLEKESRGAYDFYFVDGWLGTIKYVHQLQNLFYALTRKELTIKTESNESK
jgi:hypothetical protein